MSDIGLVQCEIDSHRLGNRRTLWMQPPRVPSEDTCIFLDGEYYLAHVRAASIVAELQATEAIPPVTAVTNLDRKRTALDSRSPPRNCHWQFSTRFLARS